MTNADNSRIANGAVDTLFKVTEIAKLGLAHDKDSIAAAALKDILKAVQKFKETEIPSRPKTGFLNPDPFAPQDEQIVTT